MADSWESNGGERAKAEILIGLDRLRTFLKGEQNIGEGPPPIRIRMHGQGGKVGTSLCLLTIPKNMIDLIKKGGCK